MKKFFTLGIFLICLQLVGTSQLCAEDIPWSCSICEETFSFDPIDKNYSHNFINQHLQFHESNQNYSDTQDSQYRDHLLEAAIPIIRNIYDLEQRDIAKVFLNTPEEIRKIKEEFATLKEKKELYWEQADKLKESSHHRLIGSLKKISDTSSLKLKTISPGMKTGEAPTLSPEESNNEQLFDDLLNAAFLVGQAAQAVSEEKAGFLREQALIALDGGELLVSVPPLDSAAYITKPDIISWVKIQKQLEAAQNTYLSISIVLARKHKQLQIMQKAIAAGEEKLDKLSEQNQLKADDFKKILKEAKFHYQNIAKSIETIRVKLTQARYILSQKEKLRVDFINQLSTRLE